MVKKTLALGFVVIVAAAALGSTAFTTATVDRSTTITVGNDAASYVGLADGNSGDFVYTDADGALAIDFTKGGSDTNVDATYTLGDESNPGTTYAFSVTNNDDSSRTFDVSYALSTDPDGNTNNVDFKIWDGTNFATVNESNSQTITLSSAETREVVVVVDTNGLTDGDSLSGTLTVTAS